VGGLLFLLGVFFLAKKKKKRAGRDEKEKR